MPPKNVQRGASNTTVSTTQIEDRLSSEEAEDEFQVDPQSDIEADVSQSPSIGTLECPS